MWVENILINAFTLFLVCLTCLYLYFKHRYNYWNKENVAFLRPEFPYGSAKPLIFSTACFGNTLKQVYDDVKQLHPQYGGFFMFSSPNLMLVDPELIKCVLTKDFANFHDRNFFVDEDIDPLGAHLVGLKGQKWKNSRAKITPTFTSGKMKIMFNTILSTTERLVDIINGAINRDEVLDSRDIFARLATDTIGSCAFGIDCNSLEDPEVEFRKYGNKVFEFGIKGAIINMLATNFPFILKWFKIPQIQADVTKFFMNVLRQTVDYREQNGVVRNDFLNLLIRLKNRQSVLEDGDDKNEDAAITFNELAAHSFVFFAAGFETSSSTLNFCLFELATNMAVQEKARHEVFDVLKERNALDYEAIMSMKYMDKIFSEVLRKYPPIPMLTRKCTSDYKIPGSNITIKKDIDVVISTLGIQNDPKHYPDPEKFDPERFSDEEKAKRHPYTYLPFGEGPRICIGMRFALLQAKIVLAVLLKNFRFTLDSKTVTPVVFSPASVFLCPRDKIWLKAEKIH